MADLHKFYADVQRIVKHERSDNLGSYNGRKACEKVSKLFISYLKDWNDIAEDISNHWFSAYIDRSSNLNEEPSSKNVDFLAGVLALFDGETDESQNSFSDEDWQELKDLVSAEAEELPIEVLTSIMSIFVDRKIL